MSLTFSLHFAVFRDKKYSISSKQKNFHSLSTPPTEAVGRVGGGVSPTAGGQGA